MRKPDAIDDAPNTTKHPAMTVAARRQSIRPWSISKPTAATATIAIDVAAEPSNAPSNQSIIAENGLPEGSKSDTPIVLAVLVRAAEQAPATATSGRYQKEEDTHWIGVSNATLRHSPTQHYEQLVFCLRLSSLVSFTSVHAPEHPYAHQLRQRPIVLVEWR